jgi:hypothetical protein
LRGGSGGQKREKRNGYQLTHQQRLPQLSTPRAIVAGMAIRFAIGFRYLIVGIFLRKGGFSLSGLACGATIGNSPTISPGTQDINRFCG